MSALSDTLAILLLPLTLDFMQQALWMGLLVGTVCAVLSCLVVLKGWSLVGDAASHAVVPGIVLAWLLGIPMVIGALISALSCLMGAGVIERHCRIRSDAVLGITFTGFLALGMVLVAAVPSDVHFMHILLGNLLGIEASTRLQLIVTGAVVLGVVLLKFSDLRLYCFDPQQASVMGIDTHRLQFLLTVLLTLASVMALQAVGVVLVIAMLVTPGSTAFLLTRRLAPMMAVAAVSTWLSVVSGVMISFYMDVETGAVIVLVQAFLFLMSFLFAPGRGVVFQRMRVHRAIRSDREALRQ
ncbi:metal ABC transporter permease [Kushneria konosiri]|uniref:Iron ABC transporter permease n=1 Tax=Kushneria konosiri TaxID=698828 RepID=A0A2Z2H4X5_9GAMM|nr:metal ABC transporter permease [Kushneria konosiri]ARS51826.1 hypothetical protein B9G99_02045 [Kushneria konosiri]